MHNLEEMKNFILTKVKNNAQKFEDRLPTATEAGKYKFADDGFWVGGFWTGLNFLCYQLSGDAFYLEAARKSRHRFKKRLYEKPETLDHDIGFLYILSCVADYKITGNTEARKMALDAAHILAGRFNERGQFIQAWNVGEPGNPFSEENRGRIIVDCMYNLPILFWASSETGNEKYANIAKAHAQTCIKHAIRPDYTTYHTFVFDPDTGLPKYGRTCQGYADASCWARGQAWTLGGFTYTYAYTGIEEYLNIAKNCAKIFIDNLESDFVPMWDFSLPSKENQPRDTSAGAIAMASMLELAKHVPEAERDYYKGTALKMLQSLYINYSTKDMPEDEGLLIHACGHKPINVDTDCSLIYGDYYFAETVARLVGWDTVYW